MADSHHFVQIVADNGAVVTVGTRANGPANHFAVWNTAVFNADGSEALPYVVIFSAGSKAGGFDDHEAAWLEAVAEGHRLIRQTAV